MLVPIWNTSLNFLPSGLDARPIPSARQMRSRASPPRKGSFSSVMPSSEMYQVWSPGWSSCMGPSDSTRTAMTKGVRLALSQNSAPI